MSSLPFEDMETQTRGKRPPCRLQMRGPIESSTSFWLLPSMPLLRSYLSKFNKGDTLWSSQPSLVLKRVKEALVTLGVPRAQYVSFTSWRAGRATQMAQSGLSLADILMAGECRSIAFARYCLTVTVIINPVGVLDNTLRNESEEDDGEVPAECTRIPRTPR